MCEQGHRSASGVGKHRLWDPCLFHVSVRTLALSSIPKPRVYFPQFHRSSKLPVYAVSVREQPLVSDFQQLQHDHMLVRVSPHPLAKGQELVQFPSALPSVRMVRLCVTRDLGHRAHDVEWVQVVRAVPAVCNRVCGFPSAFPIPHSCDCEPCRDFRSYFDQ